MDPQIYPKASAFCFAPNRQLQLETYTLTDPASTPVELYMPQSAVLRSSTSELTGMAFAFLRKSSGLVQCVTVLPFAVVQSPREGRRPINYGNAFLFSKLQKERARDSGCLA